VIHNSAKKMRIAVGVSGGGRSLQNLIEQQKNYAYSVEMVFSSSPNIEANRIAERSHLPLVVLDFSQGNSSRINEIIFAALAANKIDFVVLAGFLKLFPIVDSWTGRIINIHPALLPRFGGRGMYGRNVHEAVLNAGETSSGATVHFVNAKYDEGSLIAQVKVPVLEKDTPETLGRRVFDAECRLLPAVIGAIAEGQLPKKMVAQLDERGEWT
jgi:phosphoribosylglycinamide formyltransferase-1